MYEKRGIAAGAQQSANEQLPERDSRYMRYHQTAEYPQGKTYRFFLLIENKEFTKIVSLIGNDLATSGFLHSAIFCTNQKNAFQYTKVTFIFEKQDLTFIFLFHIRVLIWG